MTDQKQPFVGYIGTYSQRGSNGVYRFTLDPENKSIDTPVLAAELLDSTYVTISKDQKTLYSIYKDGATGGVAAFSINEGTGELTFLGKELSPNGSYCHISVDSENKHLLTANYGLGYVEAFPVKDSKPGPLSSSIHHTGHGPKKRQEGAHTHFAGFSPDERFIAVVDLGIDKIITYTLEDEKLTEIHSLSLEPGTGPRHLVFHPSGKFAFVLAELEPKMIVLSFDQNTGEFSKIETVRTVPEEFQDNNQGSAIHISQDGKFVYAANRGHDSIAVFQVNDQNGHVSLVEIVSTEGHWPRDFSIDPSGEFLVASNQESDNLTLYKRNQETGKLELLQKDVQVPCPVCVKFLA